MQENGITKLRAEIREKVDKCDVCLRSGEPKSTCKFSLSKMHREFNSVVQMDIAYWGKQMMLHVVDAERHTPS